MTWSIVQNPVAKVNSASVSHASLTTPAPSIGTTAGHSLIAIVWGFSLGGGTVTVTDSAGNSYTINQSVLAAQSCVAIASAHNTLAVPSSTGSFTCTLGGTPGSNTYWGFFVLEFATGQGAGNFDTGANGTQGTSATPSAGPTGAIAGGNELVLQANCYNFNTATNTSVSGTGWSATATDGPITSMYGCGAWEALNSSGTVTAAQITANGLITSSVAVVAVYKAATSGSGGGRVPNVPTLTTLPTVGSL